MKASLVGDHFLNSHDPNECVRSIIFCRGTKMTVLGQYKTKDKKRFLSQARTTFFIPSFGFVLETIVYTTTTETSAKIYHNLFLKIMMY